MNTDNSQITSGKKHCRTSLFGCVLIGVALLIGIALLPILAVVSGDWVLLFPNPPVTITFRGGLLSDHVLQVHNMSVRGFEFYVYVANDKSSYRTVRKVLKGNSEQEFGALELNGWNLKPGDKGFVKLDNYAKKIFFEIGDDNSYRKWYGVDDIPEIDVARKVRIAAEARRIAQMKKSLALARAEAENIYICLTNMTAKTNTGSSKVKTDNVWPKAKIKMSLGERLKKAYSKWKNSTPEDKIRRFGNSQEFFHEMKTNNISLANLRFKWSVLADADGIGHTNIPVLVSANFNWKKFHDSKDICDGAQGQFLLCPTDELRSDAMIMVFGDGRIESIVADRLIVRGSETNGLFSYAFDFKEEWNKVRYLTPNGIVAVADHFR